MMTKDEDFDGFITLGGERISVEDTDRVSAIFLKTADVHKAVKTLWQLAGACCGSGYFDAAGKYLETIVPLVDAPDHKAYCFLLMGQTKEELGDYEAAQEAYARAFDLPLGQNTTWYFLNNNRGYCLNQIGRHHEAEAFCRAAIAIEPERHNAYKNLGVTLANLGRNTEAAKNYIHATKLYPGDPRALALLDDLFADHHEIVQEIPDFPAQLHECHELVHNARCESLLQ